MRAIARESIQALALALLLAALFQAGAQAFQVRGASMAPSLSGADHLLVDKAGYLSIDAERAARFIPGLEVEPGTIWRPFGSPSRGDIVVFRYPLDPQQLFVKRIIGLPGEAVRIENGAVYIDGRRLEEPYLAKPGNYNEEELLVGPGQYYVLGDNRLQSSDSRQWGAVPEENIIGKAVLRFWPLADFDLLVVLGLPLW